MNQILNYYKEKNTIKEWKENHESSAHDNIMYAYNGTNGRGLKSFYNAFDKMKEVEGKNRKDWPKSEKTNQEIHKQYTARVLQAKLFYQSEGVFNKTSKGFSYDRFLKSNLKDNDKFLVNLIYIFDGYFYDINNYLFERSKEIKNSIEYNLTDSEKQFCKKATNIFVSNLPVIKKFSDFIEYDYFYLHSMFDDHEFIKLYVSSSEDDRKELKEYILSNYNSGKYNCCLSKKYKPGGVYTINTLKEDSLVYSISLSLSEIHYIDFDSTVNKLTDILASYMIINKNVIINFLNEEKNIIDAIFKNIFNCEEIEEPIVEDVPISDVDLYSEIDKPEPRIDDTTIEGKKQISYIFASRKKIARLQSEYKCALEDYNDCKYFTSKTTNQNYVEVHHFIPREFSNNFGYSIDVLANYVTLCPHCHKMIHLATDRERKNAINYIYKKRIDRLNHCGLEVDIKEIYKYYSIER